MSTSPASIPGFDHAYSGKVRDLYVPAGTDMRLAETLLMVASDRVSAFDHMLEPAIPGKGATLTSLTRWWLDRLDVPNQLAGDADDIPESVRDRSLLVKALDMVPIECVVRGYLTGSGYTEYLEHGTVCGIALPAGLADGDRLPEPIFTPAWKAPQGEHDENISFERTAELVGADVAGALRALTISIYVQAAAIAERAGLILADTKLEFGHDRSTRVLTLGDEVLTSDSSRYWDAALWADGVRDQSFDKQIVRNWLSASWDGEGTPPELPAEIVEQTAARYRELLERLSA